MRFYSECYAEAQRLTSDLTTEQVIQMANGMYQAELIKAGIKSIEDRLFADSQGYKGLRTLIHEATAMCKRIGR